MAADPDPPPNIDPCLAAAIMAGSLGSPPTNLSASVGAMPAASTSMQRPTTLCTPCDTASLACRGNGHRTNTLSGPRVDS